MLDSCFVPFKLDYSATKVLAVVGNDVVTSVNFSAGGYLWRVLCYPRGYDGNKHLSIYLELMSEPTGVVEAVIEAFLMVKDGAPSPSIASRLMHAYGKNDFVGGWPQFVKRSDLESRYVVDGCVTIVCGVIVVRGDRPLAVPPSDIGDHLGQLDFTDGSLVSFVVAGKTFTAHRAVLAARSPVFKAELLGARISRIELQDIEAATFQVLLRFMYTDVLPGDDELIGDDDDGSPMEMYQHLLAAADRYAMERLKMMCANKLWDYVSVDKITAVLACAMTYKCLELRTKCVALFVEDENFKAALFTDDYVQLVHKFPSLLAELRAKALAAQSHG